MTLSRSWPWARPGGIAPPPFIDLLADLVLGQPGALELGPGPAGRRAVLEVAAGAGAGEEDLALLDGRGIAASPAVVAGAVVVAGGAVVAGASVVVGASVVGGWSAESSSPPHPAATPSRPATASAATAPRDTRMSPPRVTTFSRL